MKTLCSCKASALVPLGVDWPYLFVANGELPGGDLVLTGKLLHLLDRVALQDRDGKLDVRLGVLVPGLSSSAVYSKQAETLT